MNVKMIPTVCVCVCVWNRYPVLIPCGMQVCEKTFTHIHFETTHGCFKIHLIVYGNRNGSQISDSLSYGGDV